ncbi:hypothetical protein SAMN05216558_2661 [Pseudomonas vancouverensis]|nr:hypothetical protein SAMN05216558_2661 [Pseudomonas vancouverensis]
MLELGVMMDYAGLNLSIAYSYLCGWRATLNR